jgi:hypothetical protein
MADSPDPLADPLTVPPGGQGGRPVCPQHGAMTIYEPGQCGWNCTCKPAVFRCPGFDGEGCAHAVRPLDELREMVARKLDELLAGDGAAG